MKIVTAAEMREIDRTTTEKYGVPSLLLMENAGAAVAADAIKHFPEAQRILIVCGKGNNGGDGLVAARKLQAAGKEVILLLLGDPSEVKGDAGEMLKQLPLKPITISREQDLEAALRGKTFDLLIDAVFGTGFRPPARGIAATALTRLDQLPVPRLAVDLPSGLDADSNVLAGTCIRADRIATFTALKPVHRFALSRVPTTVHHIGTPDQAIQSSLNMQAITPADFRPLLQPRQADANKGSFGHVLVIGGSPGKSGAPAMTGMAALRAGAGLVTVAVPKGQLPLVAGFMPELMTFPITENDQGVLSILALEQIREMMSGKNAVALGPGLSRDGEAAQFARAFFDRSEGPLVVDADGLNAFIGHVEYLKGGRHHLVLTPHPAELSRLNGKTVEQIQADRVTAAREFAQQQNAYLVLKGAQTVVAEPDGKIWINNTGNPGMATGGTGDILTGIIAGLLGQFPEDVAPCVIAGVHLHGLAGDLARDELGEKPLVATDLLRFLPAAFRRAGQG